MTHFINILILIIVISSCQIDKKNSLDLCEQELNLIKGNSTLTVEYDFNLDKQKQFENFQSQIDINICNGVFPLNGRFCTSTSDTINVLIFAERFCENDTTNNSEILCFLTRSLKIQIDSISKIRVEDEIVPKDSLTDFIAHRAEEFFIKNEFEYAIFDLESDKNTLTNLKKYVFERVVDGYLLAAEKYSIRLFNKKICKLNNDEIIEITRNFRLVIGVSDDVPKPPPPPPPPKYLIDE